MNDEQRKKWEDDNIRGAFRIMEILLDETKQERDSYARTIERLLQEFKEREKELLFEIAQLKRK